ncbi:MarR family transcriptional regulator [Streptomyces sp. NPDC048191]|uniref:MarR family transcriptional regulator n=1 Tax=Streptomyces sp. NPDC048191 TaxID=3155484 RepID=UPI0033DA4EE3
MFPSHDSTEAVAARMATASGALSRLADRLAARGLVRREADPDARRTARPDWQGQVLVPVLS